MNGQTGGRGYLVQALIAVLDAVTGDPDWTEVSLEPNLPSDKVDVVWYYPGRSKVVQVKSSANAIARADAKRWAEELEASITADEYELRLVGSVTKGAANFSSHGRVRLPTPLNLNLDSLRHQAAHALDYYLQARGLQRLGPDAREMLVDALTSRLSAYAASGERVGRADFDATLLGWITDLPRGLSDPSTPGPAPRTFLAPADFFRGLLDTGQYFHHSLELVGRTDRLASLVGLARQGGVRVVVLPGRGGIGKSRLLRAYAQVVEEGGTGPSVLFLADGVSVTDGCLGELPATPCLVVVDDAHRCDGLARLLAHARRRQNLKLLLATRPHGLDAIHSDLTRSGFDIREVEEHPPLDPLSAEEVRELARAALGPEWRDRVDVVDRLARVTRDCPLATVIGGRLLAEYAIPPELLAQDGTFRRAVFDRFRDEYLGHLGQRVSPELARRVLDVLAAVNPIPAEGNQEVLGRVAQHLRADPVEVSRLAGELEWAGLLVRRGRWLRLTPDVFADYILATACLTPQGRPTGFAEQVFESFRDTCPELVLRNLAELDWRSRSSAGAEARLLDGMWESITQAFRTGSNGTRAQILSWVKEAAVYQPRRVLGMAQMAVGCPVPPPPTGEELVTDGEQEVIERLPDLLGRCAYTPSTLPECLELLWVLCLRDTRPGAAKNGRAFRVLADLAKYEYLKHFWMNEAVSRVVVDWFRSTGSRTHREFLLELVGSLLAKSGVDAWAEGGRFRQVSFLVPYEGVRELRRSAFALLRVCLDSPDLWLRLAALDRLQEALNGPAPFSGLAVTAEVLAGWEPDQLEILDLLSDFMASQRPPVVQLRVLEAVRFQAAHGGRPTVRDRARSVLLRVDDSFEVWLARLLLPRLSDWDDYEDDDLPSDGRALLDRRLDRHRRMHDQVVPEFWRRYPTAEAAFSYLRSTSDALRDVDDRADPCHFLWYLLEHRPDQAAAFARHALAAPDSSLAACLPTCLVHVRRSDPAEATVLVRAALGSGHLDLARGAARYFRYDWPVGAAFSDDDVEAVRTMLGHPDLITRQGGVDSLRHLALTRPGLAVELTRSVEIDDSEELSEQLAALADPTHGGFPEAFGDDELLALVAKLERVVALGHWGCRLLQRVAARAPDKVLDLLLRRIEAVGLGADWLRYHPLPDLGLREVFNPVVGADARTALARRVRDRALAGDARRSGNLPRLFRAVSGNYGPDGLAVLREWFDSGDPERVAAAAELLAAAGTMFIFDHLELVGHALDRSAAIGPESGRRVRLVFYRLATLGSKSGTAGRPYPQDVSRRDRAVSALQHVPPGTPLHLLLEDVRRDAERDIREAVADVDDE